MQLLPPVLDGLQARRLSLSGGGWSADANRRLLKAFLDTLVGTSTASPLHLYPCM